MARRVFPVVASLTAAVLAWGAVYQLVVVENVGTLRDFWAPQRVLAYAIFILAPALTFMPIGRLLRIPLYDLEAIAAWSTLAFVVTFTDPGRQPPLPLLLLLLISTTMALATLFTLVSYAIGFRVLTRRSQRYDFVRARREGYLGAMFVVGCLLLSMLGVLTGINAALLGLIVLLLEVFLLSRNAAAGRDPEAGA